MQINLMLAYATHYYYVKYHNHKHFSKTKLINLNILKLY